MKKVQPSGAQNRKKGSGEEVEETGNNEAAESSSDTSGEKKDFSPFLQRNDFGYLKKPVPDNLKITIIHHGPERYQNKSCIFVEKDRRSSFQQWLEKVSTNGEIVGKNGCCTLHIDKHVTVSCVSYLKKNNSLQTLARKKVSPFGES